MKNNNIFQIIYEEPVLILICLLHKCRQDRRKMLKIAMFSCISRGQTYFDIC
jgi:hypothetical protein